MKIIRYTMAANVNRGTSEAPVWEQAFFPVEMGWNPTNEEIARREAYEGRYTLEDDGMEEPAETSLEGRIAELEAALAMILKEEVV